MIPDPQALAASLKSRYSREEILAFRQAFEVLAREAAEGEEDSAWRLHPEEYPPGFIRVRAELSIRKPGCHFPTHRSRYLGGITLTRLQHPGAIECFILRLIAKLEKQPFPARTIFRLTSELPARIRGFLGSKIGSTFLETLGEDSLSA